MKLQSCLLCKSPHLTIALKLKPTPLGDEFITKRLLEIPQPSYPLTLMLCKSCGHVQLQNIILPKRIYRNYIYQTISSPGLVSHFHSYAEVVLKRLKPPAGALVIEIGSNDGTLLREFKKAGYRVLGIDPAVDIARKATKSGIPTLSEFFTLPLAHFIRKKYGEAAIITANNVVANVTNLHDFSQGIKELLAPSGTFVFESFYLLDIVDKMIFDNIYHEHISYFSVTPLKRFFNKNGLELKDATHVATKGGSIRYFVQHDSHPKRVAPSVAKSITIEKQANLQNIRVFTSFERSILKAKKQLLDLVVDLKKRGKTIAGFGASPSSTTLMYHFGLLDTLDCLFDENPIKLNTFSPGRHIPVLSPLELYKRKPDYIILLAWRFSDQIIKKYYTFRQLGGHFIVPLPTVRVI